MLNDKKNNNVTKRSGKNLPKNDKEKTIIITKLKIFHPKVQGRKKTQSCKLFFFSNLLKLLRSVI